MAPLHVVALSIAIGMLIPVQAAANARLGSALGQPLWAVAVTLTVGATSLYALLLLGRTPLPLGSAVAAAPRWVWLGGLCGAAFVTAGTLFVPRIGAASFLVATIAGQLIAAMLLDHKGWLGLTQTPADLKRIGGLLLVVTGALLISAGRQGRG